MKKKEILVLMILTLFMGTLIGYGIAMFKVRGQLKKSNREMSVCGYTKIEYGLAINCKGDTIHIKEGRERYHLKDETK